MPVVVQRQMPDGSEVKKTLKVPQVQYFLNRWSMSSLCRSAGAVHRDPHRMAAMAVERGF